MFYGVVIPVLAYLGLFLYKQYYYESILGQERQFENCQITQYDPVTGSTFTQKEDVKIVQVNYGIKLVEADTFMGAMYGLGFVHAKDRLWQLNFFRYLATGRLAELIGPEGVPIDKFIRTIGVTRSAKKYLELLDEEEMNLLQNYCNGVNKAAQNVKLYPIEFYILMTGFEELTTNDVASYLTLLTVFLSRDWCHEYLRSKLTEIYDREFVDRLIPFKKEDYFDLGKMETIADDDLHKIDLHIKDNAANLYTVDDSLYHVREKTKSKLEVQAELNDGSKPYRNVVSSWENFGSNCWAIHGNHTKSGKPMLSCDPHLVKYTSPTWYAARISWNETTIEETETGPVEKSYRTYIAGHSVLGLPIFSHMKTPFVAGGLTALNPDSMDLFLEEVKDEKYLSSEGTW